MFGIDYLLGAQYSRSVLRAHPDGWAAGFFAGYYRNRHRVIEDARKSIAVIKKLLTTGKTQNIRIHILWDDNHSFSDADIPLIRQVSRQYQAIATQFPKATIEISPFCEHQLTNPNKYLDIVAEEAPRCTPVNTPMDGGALSSKHKNEIHGFKQRPSSGKYNYGFDGLSALDADTQAMKNKHKVARCETFYFWMPQLNRKRYTHESIARPNREVRPTTEQIKSLAFLHTHRGNCRLPSGWLWKSHADQHNVPTPSARESKPLLILPEQVNRVELMAGKAVAASLSPTGQMEDGSFVWRLAEYGYQLMQREQKKQKSLVLRLRVDGKIRGRINAAFRFGSFRS